MSYIEFKPVRSGSKSGWAVVNKRSGDPLGVVVWYSGWHLWVFRPLPETEFSQECLRDIDEFMSRQEVG